MGQKNCQVVPEEASRGGEAKAAGRAPSLLRERREHHTEQAGAVVAVDTHTVLGSLSAAAKETGE